LNEDPSYFGPRDKQVALSEKQKNLKSPRNGTAVATASRRLIRGGPAPERWARPILGRPEPDAFTDRSGSSIIVIDASVPDRHWLRGRGSCSERAPMTVGNHSNDRQALALCL